jgi:DNA (cytosine-5)-methyltransferase 1
MSAALERVGYKQPDITWNGLTVTDLFCGAGGSSSGLVAAGFKVAIAANHWEQAIASHQINHPETDHSNADISQVNPGYFPRTDILWASPECTNHSVAKGVKRQRVENAALFDADGTVPLPDEAANRSRATMWDVPRFAEHHQYRAIIIENVVDAAKWVPFPAWLMTMELLGYEHEQVWLNSMHAQAFGLPAPQSRDRMYVVFWRKGERKPNLTKWTRPQAFCEMHGIISAVQAFKKDERWGRYRAQYVYRCPNVECRNAIVEPAWLPASSAIDWSIPGERIGDKKKPLAEKTLARIRKGIERYWQPIVVEASGNQYDSCDPKHVSHGKEGAYIRAWPTDEVLKTLHTTGTKGVAVPPPFLTQFRERNRTLDPAREPLTTIVADGAGQGLVQHAAMLVPVEGREGKSAALASGPHRTQSTRNETALVVPLRNHGVTKPAGRTMDTISAGGNHHALVMRNNTGGAEMSTPVTEELRTLTTHGHQSLLVPYYSAATSAKPTSEPHGTLTTGDRYGLMESDISLDVDDVLFRMLTPDEIKIGMAFAPDYYLGGNKREQVKQAGNAVTPPAARDLGMAVAEALNKVELERGAA